eukprot:3136-Heterococcus_DN1.PRE.2
MLLGTPVAVEKTTELVCVGIRAAVVEERTMHTAYNTTATPQQQVVLLEVCHKPLLLTVVHLLLQLLL